MERPHDTDPLAEAPLLRSIPKDSPFAVPDGFFDHFPHQVQNAIAQRGSAPWWRQWLPGRTPVRVAWATAVIAVVALVWLNRPSADDASAEDLWAHADWTLADTDLLAELALSEAHVPGIQHDLTADELAAYLQAHDATEFLVELQ